MWSLTPWGTLKTILIAVANILLEVCYTFTGSWAVASHLAIWSAIWKTADWHIKDSLLRVANYGGKITTADQTVCVSDVDAMVRPVL